MTEQGPKRRRWVFPALFALLLAGAGLGLALYQSWLRIPANWVPWGDVALEERPSWFARLQINSLAVDPEACFAALDRSELEYNSVPTRPVEDGCGLVDAVRFQRSHVAYSGSFAATCALGAALYWWEAELDRLARRHLGARLARIEHLGSYACRNVNSAETGRRSQHATANAIDIASFRLEDGRTVSILRDWGEPTPEGRFLADAHDSACGLFNTVLGPEHNALHAGHFHLDLGRFRVCR